MYVSETNHNVIPPSATESEICLKESQTNQKKKKSNAFPSCVILITAWLWGIIGDTLDLFGQTLVNKMDGDEARSCFEALEVCRIEEQGEWRIEEGRKMYNNQ